MTSDPKSISVNKETFVEPINEIAKVRQKVSQPRLITFDCSWLDDDEAFALFEDLEVYNDFEGIKMFVSDGLNKLLKGKQPGLDLFSGNGS